MTERPILFSAEMVRAILKGDKTQTRRVIKPQPQGHHWEMLPGYQLKHTEAVMANGKVAVMFRHTIPQNPSPDFNNAWIPCPYGAPGDLLWGRETCWAESVGEGGDGVRYAADHAWRIIENTQEASEVWCQLLQYGGDYGHHNESNIGRRVPSIHMPRWASRITLRITDVRVERLHDISEDDARAEGATPATEPPTAAALMSAVGRGAWFMPHRSAFANIWNTINGPSAWDANPWVWALSFERVKP